MVHISEIQQISDFPKTFAGNIRKNYPPFQNNPEFLA